MDSGEGGRPHKGVEDGYERRKGYRKCGGQGKAGGKRRRDSIWLELNPPHTEISGYVTDLHILNTFITSG